MVRGEGENRSGVGGKRSGRAVGRDAEDGDLGGRVIRGKGALALTERQGAAMGPGRRFLMDRIVAPRVS